MKSKLTILKYIALANLKIALFSFGGGVAVLSLVHKEFIEKYKLVSNKKFNNMVLLANALPGPTIFQLTVYLSFETGKISGFCLAMLINLILPPAILILAVIITHHFIPVENLQKIAQAILPAIIGMLLAFTIQLFLKNTTMNYNWIAYSLIFMTTLVLLMLQVQIIIIILGLIIALLFMSFL